jgi:Ca2+-dependent lipid-binding protein
MAKKAGVWKGMLRVFLISAKDLLVMDSKTSDPKVIFKVAGGKQMESAVIKETVNPVWNKIYDIPVNMARNVIFLDKNMFLVELFIHYLICRLYNQ